MSAAPYHNLLNFRSASSMVSTGSTLYAIRLLSWYWRQTPMRGLSQVYDIFIGFVARYNKDGLLRGHQMSGARPIKISYTWDLPKSAGFSASTEL
jgi:hypothetical protein